MSTLLKALGWIVLAGVLVVAAALIYSTSKGSTKWYFRVDGHVTINGVETGGYMHANTQRTLLLVTRTDDLRPETYLVTLEDQKFISDCGVWHPIRFLPFPVSQLNPPCSPSRVDDAKIQDAPLPATLVRSPRSVQFSTASGKKVKAEW